MSGNHSPRSGRQRKAWGGASRNPRYVNENSKEPAERATAFAITGRAGKERVFIRLSPAPRAVCPFPQLILGLTPQALRCRPLRGLSALFAIDPGAHAPGFTLSPAPR